MAAMQDAHISYCSLHSRSLKELNTESCTHRRPSWGLRGRRDPHILGWGRGRSGGVSMKYYYILFLSCKEIWDENTFMLPYVGPPILKSKRFWRTHNRCS